MIYGGKKQNQSILSVEWVDCNIRSVEKLPFISKIR